MGSIKVTKKSRYNYTRNKQCYEIINNKERNYFTLEIVTRWNMKYGKITYNENEKLDNCTKYIKETKE